MTVTTSNSRSGPYAGAGTTGPFAVTFRFLDKTHLRVVKTVAGVDTTLAVDSQYTVAGVGAASGTVTLLSALAVGETLTIVRNVPQTQEAEYVQNDAFPAKSHETALDKLTMLVQQNAEQVARALLLPVSDTASAELPTAAARANKLLSFDSDGKPVATLLDTVTGSAIISDIANGTAPNADPLTGAEYATISRGAGVLKTTLTAIGQWVLQTYQGFTQSGAGAVARTAHDKLRDSVSIKDFGASTADTNVSPKIQAGIDALALVGGGRLFIPAGVWTIGSTLVLKTGVTLVGAGKEVTTLRLANGANVDMIKTDGFGTFTALTDAGVPHDYGILDLTLDGNYLQDAWNNATNTINNSTGYGLKSYGYGFEIDIEVKNIPEVGLFFDGAGSPPATQDAAWRLDVYGRVFGKEGVIIRGPGDGMLRSAWIGLCGILPRPTSHTTLPTSTVWSGEAVDGIVLEDVNLEIGVVHVYACWAGTGFRVRDGDRGGGVRGACRIEADHIISESNRAQIYLESNTYGMISLCSIRSLALLYPSWTGGVPVYAGPDRTYDGITLDCRALQIGSLRMFRTASGANRVKSSTALVVLGDGNTVSFQYDAVTGTGSDPETGAVLSGDAVLVRGSVNNVRGSVRRVRGSGVVISDQAADGTLFTARGNCNSINVTVENQTDLVVGTDAAFKRIATANDRCSSNLVNVTANVCERGFHSTGTPMAEQITLLHKFSSGKTIWAGDNRTGGAQEWRFIGSVSTTATTSPPVFGSEGIYTIASDAVTIQSTDAPVRVDTEASAATDDLATINGGVARQIIILRSTSVSRDITVKDAVGNIRLPGDFVLSHPEDRLMLIYDGTNWCQLTSSDNSA